MCMGAQRLFLRGLERTWPPRTEVDVAAWGGGGRAQRGERREEEHQGPRKRKRREACGPSQLSGAGSHHSGSIPSFLRRGTETQRRERTVTSSCGHRSKGTHTDCVPSCKRVISQMKRSLADSLVSPIYSQGSP